MLQWLIQVTAPWNELYADSAVLSTGIVFVHLAAILVAGGTAMTADRRMLAALRTPDLRKGYIEGAESVHRTVIRALAIVIAAGVLLFLADVESLADSVVFRVKLVLIFMLLMNGLIIMKFERGLLSAPEEISNEPRWLRLGVTARVSLTLWLSTLLAGVALRNV